jgi:hypothetical protein
MGVPTPTSAPTPFPEGDPRNGKYFENLAALEHQLSNSLAGDKQDLTSAQANYDYSTGQLDKQLPLTLQTTRNTANNQGLLESGQLAQRAGSVESKYAEQRGRLTANLQAEQNHVQQAENSASESFNLGRGRAAQTAREEAKTQLEREAPNDQAPVTPVASPSQSLRVVGQHAQPITATPKARAAQLRRQAAKKAVG